MVEPGEKEVAATRLAAFEEKNELKEVGEKGKDELKILAQIVKGELESFKEEMMADIRKESSEKLEAMRVDMVNSLSSFKGDLEKMAKETAHLGRTSLQESVGQMKERLQAFTAEQEGKLTAIVTPVKASLDAAVVEGQKIIQSLTDLKSEAEAQKVVDEKKEKAKEIAEQMAKSWMSVKVITASLLGFMITLMSILFGKERTSPTSYRVCHDMGYYFKGLAGAILAFSTISYGVALVDLYMRRVQMDTYPKEMWVSVSIAVDYLTSIIVLVVLAVAGQVLLALWTYGAIHKFMC